MGEGPDAGQNREGGEGFEQSEGRDEGEDRETGEGLVEEAREAREGLVEGAREARGCREGAHTERLAFHQLPAWLQVMEPGAGEDTEGPTSPRVARGRVHCSAGTWGKVEWSYLLSSVWLEINKQ